MATLRVTVKEAEFAAIAEGRLNQAAQLVQSCCDALKAWRACDEDPPAA